MVPFLFSPREHHHVQSVEAYRAAHTAFVARRAAQGARYAVHDSPEPLTARIDANTWLVDCECGAGNATDPEWGIACCFGCGAVHETITFPADAALIESLLVARSDVQRRGWDAGQSLIDLIRESVTVGATVPDDAIAAVIA